ncbi:MAG: hypothetical protein U5K32_00500 [Bacteroidales bacterium]|nr:hypothetical protein [Bacteroidales bacterium]
MTSRGSGNLLGAEQSGFIADVGFETYQRILDEAMQEIREAEELRDIIPGTTDRATVEKKQRWKKATLTIARSTPIMEIMFPDYYVSNISERIRLYKELNNIES